MFGISVERVAIASQGPGGLKSIVDFRFARCPYYTIVDVEDGRIVKVQEVPNPNAMAGHGAGIAAAQMLQVMGVSAIIAGSVGPNAYSALKNMNIKVYAGISGITVEDAVQKLIRGEIRPAEYPTGPGHAGFPAGRWVERGRGRWRQPY